MVVASLPNRSAMRAAACCSSEPSITQPPWIRVPPEVAAHAFMPITIASPMIGSQRRKR